MTESRTIWVVVDEGCQECGVQSLPVGAFLSADEAVAAADARNEETGGWRDGGQTFATFHAFEIPAEVSA